MVAYRRRGVALPARARALAVDGRMPLALIVVAAFTVTALFARSIHGYFVMPDELSYVKQSLAIWHTGLPLGSGSFWFTSWGELLPLISAPIFGLLSMAHAFYVSHTLYALLLASTAIPAYLIARELELGALAANLVAALTVAVPWLVFAGLVMTEVVAYPAFVWALLLMLRAVDKPSPGRDVAALVAIFVAFLARTQLLVLAPILLVAVIVHELSLAPSVGGLRDALRRHRVLWGVAVLAGVAFALAGSSRVLGNYAAPAHGSLLPPKTFLWGREQLGSVALAIGVAPLTLAASWALATVGRPRGASRHAFAVLLVITVAVLFVVLGSFNARFLAGSTDRYMFYIAPLLFAGSAAWLVDRRGSLPVTALVGALVVWLVLTTDLHPEGPSIVSPSFSIDRVFTGQATRLGHVDPRVLIAIIASLFALYAVVVRRRLRSTWALGLVLLPLLAWGIVDTGYTMRKLSQQAGPPANWGESLAFIDRAVPAGSTVGVLIAPNNPTAYQNENLWWELDFWNKTVRRVFFTDDSLAQGAATTPTVDLARGRLGGLHGSQYLLVVSGDPRLGLAGRPMLHYGPLALYRIGALPSLSYASHGVADTGALSRSGAFVRVYGIPSTRENLTLTVSPHSGPNRTITRRVTLPASGHSDVPLAPWQRLVSVKLT